MKVLITGGTGLIGKYLVDLFVHEKIEVVIVSRKKKQNLSLIQYVTWTELAENEGQIWSGIQVVVHLAGQNVGGGRWTATYKKAILNSRVEGLRIIQRALNNYQHQVHTVISASAVGYYGIKNNHIVCDEQTELGTDFLANVCGEWEKALSQLCSSSIRTVAIRTGVVFAPNNSALQKMVLPIKMGLGAVLGTGNQVLPYIHIEDLVKIYWHLIQHRELDGAYNAVGGNVSFSVLSQLIAKYYHKTIWLPNVPEKVLKWFMGEMACIVTKGNVISNKKIKNSGFEFKYEDLGYLLKKTL